MSTATLKPKPSKRISEIVIEGSVQIPFWVTDHASFRRWAFSDDFPERGRFAFLADKLWVDLSSETDLHNQIKTVITIVVGSIVLNEALGRFYADGMLLTNRTAGLSCEPDAMFVSTKRLDSGRVTLKQGGKSMEITGSPDMALEVVSASSVEKDLVDAMTLYAKAGVREYWIVDAMAESPDLVIMRLVGGKYVAARKRRGWVASKVFGRSFRLTCTMDTKGISQFALEAKA